MKRLMLLLIVVLQTINLITARDFSYTYAGQTINYTVLDEDTKTCMTKIGYLSNRVSGQLILPANPKDGDVEYTLTVIGMSSFYQCTGLTSVVIPNTVVKIDDSAFTYCSILKTVVIPNSVKQIGGWAFMECSELTDITLPNSLETIGHDAFYRCVGLSSLVIPNSVTEIGSVAFSMCSGLKSVVIGSSVEKIGDNAFSQCTGLIKAEFASLESLCKIEFGTAESNPLNYAHHLYIGAREITEVNIPESITRLEKTFCGATELTDVHIPDTVDYIGPFTFSGCSSLKSVIIPDAVNYIYLSSFADCSNLSSVVIPASVGGIEGYAFRNCTKLTSIKLPDALTVIGEGAFINSGLTSIEIPDEVLSIQSNAFSHCVALSSVAMGKSVETIGSHTFSGCTALSSIQLPQSVKTIGEYSFYGCTSLTTANVPDKVKTIGVNTFAQCPALTTVSIGKSVETISSDAFSSSGIESIVLPYGLKTIGERAFASCTSLTSIEIPNTVSSIGRDAFAYCDGLKSVTLPKSLTEISKGAFYDCSGLTSIVIPNYVTSIEASAFYGCSGLTSVVIGTAVAKIETYAFWGCNNIKEIINYSDFHVPTINSLVFSDYSATLKVSSDVIDEYGTTVSDWRKFNEITTLETEPIRVKELTISSQEWRGKVGETFRLTVDVSPYDATDKTLIWMSNNVDVATVTEDGVVTTLKVGECYIMVTAGDGSGFRQYCYVTVEETRVEEIILSQTEWTGKVGDTLQISVTFMPGDATDQDVFWTSTNDTVADVIGPGLIAARGVGECDIDAIIYYPGYGIKSTCHIKVEETEIPVESISLSATEWSGEVGETIALSVTVSPEDATAKAVKWTSSDETVATVDNTGFVTAVGAGTAIITAACQDVSATCTVTVNAKPVVDPKNPSIAITPTGVELTEGETAELRADKTDIDEDAEVIWTSSNPEVAMVDANGVVTAVSAGEATITATCQDVSATCTVTVNAKPVDPIDPDEPGEDGINAIDADVDVEVYNLRGVRIADSLEGLSRGVYVVRKGGKTIKVVIG